MKQESLVLAESADWVSPWSPPGSTLVDTEGIRFFVDRGVATVVRAEPKEDAAVDAVIEDLVEEVLARAVAEGATQVRWTVRPSPLAQSVLDGLYERGGVIDELIDICAWDLRPGLPQVMTPADVEVRPVKTRDDVAAVQRVDAEVWGHRELTDDEVDEQAANLWPGRFGAFVDGNPAGSAGYTIVGSSRSPGESVARLFGAGVVPALRHRGVYRKLLAARLEEARGHGASLALVHARAGTSGPILRRIGFSQPGHQTVITLPARTNAPGKSGSTDRRRSSDAQ